MVLKNLIYIVIFLSFSSVSFAGNSDKEKISVKTVAGKIMDIAGESIAGAKIIVTETGETFFADFDGNFKLSLKTDKVYTLSINTIGYKSLEVKSTNLSLFTDISLSPLN